MAVFLNEMQAGCDRTMIGFPNIKCCMGFILQTKAYLYGFHFDFPGNTGIAAAAFKEFLTSRGCDVANGVMLYGASNWTERYVHGTDTEHRRKWKAEMRQIAAVLGYSGLARGFNSTIITSTEKGRYVEYRPDYPQRRCRIFWKVQNDTDFTGSGESPASLAGLAGRTIRHHKVNNYGTGGPTVTGLEANTPGKFKITYTSGFADTGTANTGGTAGTGKGLAELDYGLRLLEFRI